MDSSPSFESPIMRPFLALAPCLLAVCAATQAAPAYVLDTIRPAYFENGLVLTDINNQGVIVGNEWRPDWIASATFVIDGGKRTWIDDTHRQMVASAINDAGIVAGTGGDIITTGYIVSGDKRVALPRMKVQGSVTVGGLNQHGHVAGWAEVAAPWDEKGIENHAFIYRDGTMTDLGSLNGSGTSLANGINDAGAVVGDSRAGWNNASWHAFLHDGITMVDLGTLGGANSWAMGINNSGVVIGVSELSGQSGAHGFIYANGVMVDLDTTANSRPVDINNAGLVVGSNASGGFLYANGSMMDLNTLVAPSEWRIASADGINDRGQIVGSACNAGGICVGALLSPVPEPATYGMLLGGLAVLGVAARRRRVDAAV